MRRKRVVVMVPLLLAVACLGCGGADGPEIATVRGQVKMDGEPLANATVLFIPLAGRPAGARTDAEGNYELNFSGGREGAMLGKNTVQIMTLRDPSQDEEGKMIPGSPETVPVRYNNETELQFTVEAGKENIANFLDLTSEGRLPVGQSDADDPDSVVTPEEGEDEVE